jgi:hypothetical protein
MSYRKLPTTSFRMLRSFFVGGEDAKDCSRHIQTKPLTAGIPLVQLPLVEDLLLLAS